MKKTTVLAAILLLCISLITTEATLAAESARKATEKIVITPEMGQKIEMVGNRMRFTSLDVVSDELRAFLESIEWIELPCFFAPIAESEIESTIPEQFELIQNYPNPFNLSTVIGYDLPKACQVNVEIFNLRGQSVACLYEDHQAAGHHEITWDGRDDHGQVVATGVYFCRLTAGDFNDVKKMNLVK
jgi:hypothetical protein